MTFPQDTQGTREPTSTCKGHDDAARATAIQNTSATRIQQYWKERDLPEHSFPTPFDPTDPDIRFDELARSMGVDAVRVETPDQIGSAIDRMLADDKPFLVVTGDVKHVKYGQ